MKLTINIPPTATGQPDFALLERVLDATYELADAGELHVDRDEKRKLNVLLIEQHGPSEFANVTRPMRDYALHLERNRERGEGERVTTMFFDSAHGSLPIVPVP